MMLQTGHLLGCPVNVLLISILSLYLRQKTWYTTKNTN